MNFNIIMNYLKIQLMNIRQIQVSKFINQLN